MTSQAAPVGISVSGGGLRAAAFGLGVLQALDEDLGLLTGDEHADYLSAVSGGSYIAGSMAMLAKGLYPGEPHDDASKEGFAVVAPTRPFAHGSPEEAWLRSNCRYLLDVPGGVWATLWIALIRLADVLVIIFVAIFAAGRALGWLYGAMFSEFPAQLGCGNKASANYPCQHITLHTYTPFVAVAIGLIVIGLVAAMIVPIRRWPPRWRGPLETLSFLALGAGASIYFLLALFPRLLAELENTRRGTQSHGAWLTALVSSSGHTAITAGVALIVALLVALSGFGAARLSTTRNTIARLVARAYPIVAAALATVAGPLIAIVIFVRVVLGGATKGPGGRTIAWTTGDCSLTSCTHRFFFDWFWWLLAAVITLLALWQMDVVALSLHSTYKRRLFRCFGLRRLRSSDGTERCDQRPYSYPYPMSETFPFTRAPNGQVPGVVRQPDARFPELLVCAALNVSDRGKTAAGAKVLPWVFSAKRIGVPIEPAHEWSFDTRAIEDSFGQLEWVTNTESMPRTRPLLKRWWRIATRSTDEPYLSADNRKRLSLPAAMAITGAAFSPSMGKMTKAPVRFLMAIFNLRLGVWLPNPHNRHVRKQVAKGLPLKIHSRPWYLFFEMFGLNKLSRRFVYVSDGGHYENLGLIELLRRDCKTIWCIDASGDAPGTASTLADSIALARAELAVQIDIDLTPFTLADNSTPDARRHRAAFTRGRITYPNGADPGQLIVIKLGLTGNEPSDLIDYQRRHPTFPYDSTANQIYRADRFDAYRALGFTSGTIAAKSS
jgi:hypothetical protein